MEKWFNFYYQFNKSIRSYLIYTYKQMRKIILAALASITIAIVGGYNYFYLNSDESSSSNSLATGSRDLM